MRIKNLKYVSKIAYAFTLAEVLVVITIIGVVAALTIPVVSSNVQDSVLKAQIKKSYSTFVNAFNLWVAKYDYDHPSKVATKYGGGGHYPTQLLNEWATVMNFIKTCKDPSAEGCWHKKWYDFEGYENSALDPKFNAGGILPDGSFIVMDCFATGPTFQGYVTFKIDENGPKPPNTINKDIFEFTLQFDEYNNPHTYTDKITYYPYSRDNYFYGCEPGTKGGGCLAKVMQDID